VVTVGELADLFADRIPLHTASRKWLAGRPKGPFASPDHMRFYALTQYLHWIKCGFSERSKTRTTVVYPRTKGCPVCGRLFVFEREATCGSLCGQLLRRGKRVA